MGLKRHVWRLLSSALARRGYEIVQSGLLYDWQRSPQTQRSTRRRYVPKAALGYLTHDNPRLKELQASYAAFNPEVTAPFIWTDARVSADDMLYFRGDNAYLYQLRDLDTAALTYGLTTEYVRSIDKHGLLEKLEEDGLFGTHTFNVDNRVVSRDLLDSIIEIYFLEKHLRLSAWQNLRVLDIGAGYGRLAHRILNALPNVANYLCTDAFPVSSFVCDYYLRFRNLQDRGEVVPLDRVEQVLGERPVDLALNIHSFPECRISAINWWLALLAKARVKHLMVAPNSPELRTNDGVGFANIIEWYGYKLVAKEPKYADPLLQKYAAYPCCHYLFELR